MLRQSAHNLKKCLGVYDERFGIVKRGEAGALYVDSGVALALGLSNV
jgi:hypothetical protein